MRRASKFNVTHAEVSYMDIALNFCPFATFYYDSKQQLASLCQIGQTGFHILFILNGRCIMDCPT